LYLLLAGRALLSAVSANAVTNQPAQMLGVSKSVPEQSSFYSGTDAPLVPTEWVYRLQVRVGAKVYEVKYETAFDYSPTDLVTQGRLDARIDHGRPLRLLSQTTTNTFLPSITAGVSTPLMSEGPAGPDAISRGRITR